MYRYIIAALVASMTLMPATVAEAKNKKVQPFQRGDLYLVCTKRELLWDQLVIGIGPGKKFLHGCDYAKMTAIHGTRMNTIPNGEDHFIGYFYTVNMTMFYTCSRCKVGE